MKERLEAVIKLTTTNGAQTQEIFNLYKQLVNPQFLGCARCRASVRQAHQGLKVYYKQNYG